MKYKHSKVGLISLFFSFLRLGGLGGLDSSFRILYKNHYKMQMRTSIVLSFGTLYERIAAQSYTKFGANMINIHRTMDDYLH